MSRKEFRAKITCTEVFWVIYCNSLGVAVK
jgi:hypothetical protein